MALWTQMGQGVYSAGEKHYLWLPKSPPNASAGKRLIIACHGRGSDAWQMAAESYTAHFVRPLVEDGFTYLSIDAGGAVPWGNSIAMSRITDAWNWAKALPNLSGWIKTDKPIILGFSMGGLAALNYARIGTSPVAGVFVICPAVDIQAQYTASATYAADIEAAYGGSSWQSNAIPTYSPYQAAASSNPYSTIPTTMYYSNNDTAALTSTQEALLVRCPSIQSVNMGNIGHTPINVPELAPLEFARSCN